MDQWFSTVTTVATQEGQGMLDAQALDFLDNRGIDSETADRCGVYSTNIKGINGKSVIVFPYFEDGRLINEKFRMLPKEKFWQHKGRKEILYNVDILNDPALEEGRMPLVITEGELDTLVAIQCGFPLSVSAPNGAPPESPRDFAESGSEDQDGRYKYLWNAREKLKRVKRFILAVDADGPGRRLFSELKYQLMESRCSFVEYPFDCKDLNDVLIKHGPEEVTRVLNAAKPCPVQGLYRLSDYPDEGPLQTHSTGWPLLDRHFRPFLGEFVVITGIPQHGKSSFALQLLANMAKIHGFRSAIFSPEMRVVPVIRDRFRSFWSGKAPEVAGPDASAWVEDMFTFIGSDPRGRDEDGNFDLRWIIDKAEEAVLRDNIKILLIDPWNEVEHARDRGESMVDYVARGIRALKRFARLRNVIVIVVAHPTKMARGKDGNPEIPGLYDISDAAHWYNKCDHGLVVYRTFDPPVSEIHVKKSRFDEAGEPGSVRMRFDPTLHRFDPLQDQ